MRFFKLLLVLMLISAKFIALPMNFETTVQKQTSKSNVIKNVTDNTKSQFCETSINESEESTEDGKDFGLAKVNFTVSQFFVFKSIVLKQTYLSAWINNSSKNTFSYLFFLFLNIRI